MKGKYNLDKKFDSLEKEDIYISEITLAELKFGISNSKAPSKNKKALSNFLTGIKILPIIDALDIYANEKARLRKNGISVDDFDLLIGATAVTNDLILVTNNEKHFKRISEIKMENWIS